MEDLLVQFNVAIDKVMYLVESGEEIQARFIFNTEVSPVYEPQIRPNSSLSFVVAFWMILNEYLNDDSARALGAPSTVKKNLLEEYKEYQTEFKEHRDGTSGA